MTSYFTLCIVDVYKVGRFSESAVPGRSYYRMTAFSASQTATVPFKYSGTGQMKNNKTDNSWSKTICIMQPITTLMTIYRRLSQWTNLGENKCFLLQACYFAWQNIWKSLNLSMIPALQIPCNHQCQLQSSSWPLHTTRLLLSLIKRKWPLNAHNAE